MIIHRDLDLLQPAFRDSVRALQADLVSLKVPLAPYETIRSPARQDALWARGRDPNAFDYGRTVTKSRAWQSAHQFGMGVDFVFRKADGSWTWDEPERGMWVTYRMLARAHGLECLSFEQPHVQPAGFDWRTQVIGPSDEYAWLGWLAQRQGSPAV